MTNVPSKPRRGFTLLEALVVLSIILILIAFIQPAHRGSSQAARRSACKNNLKQIGIALHNYVDVHGALPPAYTVDENGNPLHSWRTLILPYLNQKPLYDRIDLSKPWNDPANAEAFHSHIPQYHCPSDDGPANHTTYLAIVGENHSFHPVEPRRLSEISDSRMETLLVIEAGPSQAVHWMAPMDADEGMLLSISPTAELPHAGGFQALLADGSVYFLQADTPAETRRALASIAGKESVGEF